MAKLPKHIIDKLKEARRHARLESASFGFPNDTITARHHGEQDITCHPTEYIKGRVRLHHASWIVGPIDEILEWAGVET
jgi:hypothetical protein